jgi:hypothetical protein
MGVLSVACELLIECKVYSPSSLNKFCTPGPGPQALFGDELQAAAAVAAVESEAESNTVTTTIRLRQWFEAETSETSSCSPPYSLSANHLSIKLYGRIFWMVTLIDDDHRISSGGAAAGAGTIAG